MRYRSVLIALVIALVSTGCGDDSGTTTTAVGPGEATPTTAAAAGGTPTTAPATTGAPSATTTTTEGPDPAEEALAALEIDITLPRLWRTVSSPPEGADYAAYAPSDNNFVAERLLIKALPLDPGASIAEHVELASNDLEANYQAADILGTSTVELGTDARLGQQVRFTWEQPREAGLGWRWVVAAETQLLLITFLVDISEPNLYLETVQEILATAAID